MTRPQATADTVRELAEAGFYHAYEILLLIELMQLQNVGRINAKLSEAGAAGAAEAVRNSLIARITLLVSGCYARTRKGDRHTRRAFEILGDPQIRAEVERTGSKQAMAEAHQLWKARNEDPRQKTVKHFRDKYTAHVAEPDPHVPIPKMDEFFAFAHATTRVMEKLAHAAGMTTTLDEMLDDMAGSAQEFWKPWESAPWSNSNP